MPERCSDWEIWEWVTSKIVTHIEDWVHLVKNPEQAQCIDGRRTDKESNFSPSVAWAHIWQLAAALAVLEETSIPQTRTDYKDAVLDILIKYAGWVDKFSFHNDDGHCEKWEIGCGHINLLLSDKTREKYGLSDRSAVFIKNTMDNMETPSDNDKMPIINTLHWGHKEKWVLIVRWEHYSVHANVDNHQLFVYTQDMAESSNREIAKWIYNEFVRDNKASSLTVDAITEMLQAKTETHLLETAGALANWLPMYTVRFRRNWEIEYLHKINPEEYRRKQ